MIFNSGYGSYNNPLSNLPPATRKFIKSIVVVALIVILGLILLSTSWYTVNDKQIAVVTTFGKVTSTAEAGFHLKAPFGIQKVQLVDVNVHQKIEIGYTTNDKGEYQTLGNESKMITGDFNIVNIDFFVEFKVYDPVKYLYSSINPEGILKSLIQSQIRTVVGGYNVEGVLTTEKANIQMECKELIQQELQKYDIGLQLIDVKVQDAEAPTREVIEAFKAVETAKQDKETALNEAKAYENKKIPEAEAERDQLIQNAEFLKQNRINEARKQVAMFNAIFQEYELNPTITKQRMYYEAIEAVLPGVKVIIITSDDGTQMLLPIDNFNK